MPCCAALRTHGVILTHLNLCSCCRRALPATRTGATAHLHLQATAATAAAAGATTTAPPTPVITVAATAAAASAVAVAAAVAADLVVVAAEVCPLLSRWFVWTYIEDALQIAGQLHKPGRLAGQALSVMIMSVLSSLYWRRSSTQAEIISHSCLCLVYECDYCSSMYSWSDQQLCKVGHVLQKFRVKHCAQCLHRLTMS